MSRAAGNRAKTVRDRNPVCFAGWIISPSRARFQEELREADRLAWLTDWCALPVYSEIEQAALRVGNRRDPMYPKFGRLRGQMQTLPLPDISEQIAVADLGSALARRGPRLRLHVLTVKGDIDLEWDILAAQKDWREARELAQGLGKKGWENRANGELGIIAFLKGNTGVATKLVQQALQVATQSGDVGGQLRYMATVANAFACSPATRLLRWGTSITP